MSRPAVLVLDNVNVLHNLHCVRAIEVLTADVPDKMQVVLAGRGWRSAALARLRSDGLVLEVGPKDLTANDQETASPRRHGVGRPSPTVSALTRATGAGRSVCTWPLCPGGRRGRPSRGGEVLRRRPLMMEYFWSEFLSELSAEDVHFLEETAVLDRMSGPLCDAVLERGRDRPRSFGRSSRPICSCHPWIGVGSGSGITDCSEKRS